jgi:thiamine-phosphate pyrophosphorylase
LTPFHPLQAIVDVDVSAAAGWRPVELAREYLEGGARFLQIRAKRLESGPFLEVCDAIVRLGEAYGATTIVNDRVDLALISGAAGVHVGQDDLRPPAARQLLGAAAIVGLSTHTPKQMEAAIRESISYLAVGPVFPTETKTTGYDPVGIQLVANAVRLVAGLPVVAIGGITLDRAPAVLAAGASAVAVIGDLLATGNPRARVSAYCAALTQRL